SNSALAAQTASVSGTSPRSIFCDPKWSFGFVSFESGGSDIVSILHSVDDPHEVSGDEHGARSSAQPLVQVGVVEEVPHAPGPVDDRVLPSDAADAAVAPQLGDVGPHGPGAEGLEQAVDQIRDGEVHSASGMLLSLGRESSRQHPSWAR